MAGLKAEISLPIALATAAVVYGIYQTKVPDAATVRSTMPNNAHLQTLRRQATIEAAAVVGGISLLAKDPTILVVGGALVVVEDWIHRHADAVHPQTGRMVPQSVGATEVQPPGSASAISATYQDSATTGR